MTVDMMVPEVLIEKAFDINQEDQETDIVDMKG